MESSQTCSGRDDLVSYGVWEAEDGSDANGLNGLDSLPLRFGDEWVPRLHPRRSVWAVGIFLGDLCGLLRGWDFPDLR